MYSQSVSIPLWIQFNPKHTGEDYILVVWSQSHYGFNSIAAVIAAAGSIILVSIPLWIQFNCGCASIHRRRYNRLNPTMDSIQSMGVTPSHQDDIQVSIPLWIQFNCRYSEILPRYQVSIPLWIQFNELPVFFNFNNLKKVSIPLWIQFNKSRICDWATVYWVSIPLWIQFNLSQIYERQVLGWLVSIPLWIQFNQELESMLVWADGLNPTMDSIQ